MGMRENKGILSKKPSLSKGVKKSRKFRVVGPELLGSRKSLVVEGKGVEAQLTHTAREGLTGPWFALS